jgi:hypothetical protein
MKKFLILALGALCGSTLAAKEPPRLLLPDEILSVQGIETNVYFANVFKTAMQKKLNNFLHGLLQQASFSTNI